MSEETKLLEIRGRIDAIDDELLALINRRASLAQDVAQIKREAGHEVVIRRPAREAELLRRLVEDNPGPLANDEVARLFREIISACRGLEKPMGIAFLGPQGTFTQAAALKHFGHSVQTVPLDNIDAVFREVESRSVDYGVVPIENSTEGVISHTLDRFAQSALCISGEVEMRIHHHLLGKDDDMRSIERIYSHQQSLAQCRKWLDTHLSTVECVSVSSNAEAARRAAGEERSAAIAGDQAAEIYGLRIVSKNIEDQPDNTTRFLIIGHHSVPPTGGDKTSLLLSAKDRPGALFHLLEPFAQRKISMTRIESRPSQSGLWEYVFFVDIEGHAEAANVQEALVEIKDRAALFKVLGSYPRADV